MSNISRTRNPLRHNGTSQYERLLEALTPEYFKIDDRSLKDLLHAAFQHSKMLLYYNESDQVEGDWACFWKVETLTFLAHLSTMDVEKVLRDYEKIKENFRVLSATTTGDELTLKTNEFHLALIEYLRQQALQIEEAIMYLPDALPLKQEIIMLVERDSITDTEQLAGVLKTLIGFHKEAHRSFFDERLDSSPYKPFFKTYWAVPDKSAFYEIGFSDTYRFNDQEDLDKLLKALFLTFKKIKNRANYWFDRNLDTPQLRQPHVALFLTFLRLFNHARNSLNSLTKKHLAFYYEKILCLRKAVAVPDDAYLILELAATVDQHLIEKGTAFIGGTDVNGRPLVFETIENWFLNRTQVKDIKTTYIDVNGILAKKEGTRTKQILAAPNVKTAYKEGEELPNETYEYWRGMGDNADLPNGEIGFAIASPQLILREGERTCFIEFQFESFIPPLFSNTFRLLVSTPEKFEELPQIESGEDIETEPASFILRQSQDIQYGLLRIESARRFVSDFTSDIGTYIPEAHTDSDLIKIYNRTSETSILFLSENVFYPAYQIIKGASRFIAAETGDDSIDDFYEIADYYFLRAYCFWSLAKTFAPPYPTGANTSSENTSSNLPKVDETGNILGHNLFTIGELYEQILNDLQSALHLTSGFDISALMKLHTMRSRVYLQMGRWSDCVAESDIVINSGDYQLSDSYENIFQEYHNSENIWVQNLGKLDIELANEDESNFEIYNWLNFNGEESERRSVAISKSLLDTVEDSDVRKDVFINVPDTPDPVFPDIQQAWMNKYYRMTTPDEGTGESKGMIMFRYAEVLLNKCAGLLRTENLPEALSILNEVLASRGLAAATVIDENILAKQRAIEMAFEGDRRDFLQVLNLPIPPGERDVVDVEWNSQSLYFKPPEFSSFEYHSTRLAIGLDRFVLIFAANPDFHAITHLEEPINIQNSTVWPVCKILLNNEIGSIAEIYNSIRKATLNQVNITVSVVGIQENLIIQSDQGVFDGTQKFLPFGPTPAIGNLFYIGSTELFQKEIDYVKLQFEWIDPPDDFLEYYNEYSPISFIPPRFKIDLLDRGKFPERSRQNSFLISPRRIVIRGIVIKPDGSPFSGVSVSVTFYYRDSGESRANKQDVLVENSGAFLFSAPDGITNDDLTQVRIEFTRFNRKVFISEKEVEASQDHGNLVELLVELRFDNIIDIISDFSNSIFYDYDLDSELGIGVDRTGEQLDFTRYTPSLNRGFFRIELFESDFLHMEYNNLLALKSMAVAKEGFDPGKVHSILNNTTLTDVQKLSAITDIANVTINSLPNPPYTPATNGIKLNYYSVQEILIGPRNDGIDQFFHLYPFKGYDRIALSPPENQKENETFEICLLPQYDWPTFKADELGQLANGNLYIGLENLKPGSNLSLLIQIQEGSEQNPAVEAPKINWAYLAKDNQWKPLSRSKILKDTTKALRRTGIIQITTPKDMVSETTLFEGDCYWLRAAVREEVGFNAAGNPDSMVNAAMGLPSIVDIRAQAIAVQFKNEENDLSHLAQPLPVGEIGQLQISQSAVKGIEQPFPSFNGRLPEAGNMFFVRVSERLRHRDRAVQVYDYEHLLLERFPGIQRAKCLNHTKPGTVNILDNTVEFDVELAPGYVTVAVIPELKMRSGEAAAEPRFSQGTLEEMGEYLRTKTNLFIAGKDKEEKTYLRVVNPLYEEVKLCFKVQFKVGEAPESRRFDLDLALKSYLAPWLFQEVHDITFGRTLNRSKIILFIEQLAYVEAISDFEMIHCGEKVTGNELIPTTSRSILTTVIDEEDNPDLTDHKLEPVDNICIAEAAM